MTDENLDIHIAAQDRITRPLLTATRAIVAAALSKRFASHASPQHYDVKDVVFFYGGPFSNFVTAGPMRITYPQPFAGPDSHGGGYTREYLTVEHFFQASKATLLHEHDIIANAGDPGQAKLLGNACTLREDWESVDEFGIPHIKYEIMLAGLRAKFADEHFQHYLLGTGHRYIAEDSPTDELWGIRSHGFWDAVGTETTVDVPAGVAVEAEDGEALRISLTLQPQVNVGSANLLPVGSPISVHVVNGEKDYDSLPTTCTLRLPRGGIVTERLRSTVRSLASGVSTLSLAVLRTSFSCFHLIGVSGSPSPAVLPLSTAELFRGHAGNSTLGNAYVQDWGIRDKDGGFTGQNLLGLALMEVRHEIQAEMRA